MTNEISYQTLETNFTNVLEDLLEDRIGEITIDKSGSTYTIKVDGVALSPAIEAGSSGSVFTNVSVETCSTANNPVTGLAVGDKYLDFEWDNNGTTEHTYLAVSDIAIAYTADESTLTKSSDNTFKVKNGGITNTQLSSSLKNSLEKTANKVTSISSSGTDTQYPSAKAVYSALSSKLDKTEAFSGSYTDLTNKPTIIDSVTNNDMHAVTSNAVYDAITAAESAIGTFGDLGDIIMYASNGDVIFLDKDYKNTDGHGLEFHDSITIYGNGHVIDGNDKPNGIVTDNCSVKFINVHFANFHATSQYDHVIDNGGDLTFQSCSFNGNTSENTALIGETRYLEPNPEALKIIDCQFNNNRTNLGAVYSLTDQSTTVKRCIFNNNQNTGSSAGAIQCAGEGTHSVIDSYFETAYDIYAGVTPTYTGSDEATLFSNFSEALVNGNNAQIFLSLSRDTIMVGEPVTITALFLDEDNYPIPNAYIVFKIGEYSYAAITDNDGKALLNYTGLGQGKVTVTGYYDEEVSSTSLTLYDCTQRDYGVTSDYNNIFSNVTITRGDDYSTMTANDQVKATIPVPRKCIVEFEMCTSDTTYCIGIGKGSSENNTWTIDQVNAEVNTWVKYRIVSNGTTVVLTNLNSNSRNSKTLVATTGDIVFYIRHSTGYTYYYRNVRVYTIDDDLALSVSGDEIIESGSTATVTAKLDAPNARLEGRKISYLVKKGTDILNNGVLITDSDGEASLTYTGVGRGEVDICMKYRNLLEEIFVIGDCLVHDKGLSGEGNHNDIWTVSTQGTSFTRESEYSVFSRTATDSSKYCSTTISQSDIIIEFEVKKTDGATNHSFFQALSSSDAQLYNCRLSNINGSLNSWVKCRLECNNGSVTFTNLDTLDYHSDTYTGSVGKLRFVMMNATSTEIQFRNFKVYSI